MGSGLSCLVRKLIDVATDYSHRHHVCNREFKYALGTNLLVSIHRNYDAIGHELQVRKLCCDYFAASQQALNAQNYYGLSKEAAIGFWVFSKDLLNILPREYARLLLLFGFLPVFQFSLEDRVLLLHHNTVNHFKPTASDRRYRPQGYWESVQTWDPS